jgi:hypothetical protein
VPHTLSDKRHIGGSGTSQLGIATCGRRGGLGSRYPDWQKTFWARGAEICVSDDESDRAKVTYVVVSTTGVTEGFAEPSRMLSVPRCRLVGVVAATYVIPVCSAREIPAISCS